MKRLALAGALTALFIAWMALAPVVVDQFQQLAVMNAQDEPVEPEPPLDDELVAIGRNIFEFTAGGVGCAACHGDFAMGDLGNAPNVRGATAEKIKGGLAAVGQMAFLNGQISDDDITAVAEYLRYLATLTPAETRRLRGVFDPTEVRFPVATAAQLIVDNGDRSACTFEVPDSGIEPKEIARRDAADFIWTTPQEPATFTGACAEDPENTVTIIVEAPEPDPGDGGM